MNEYLPLCWCDQIKKVTMLWLCLLLVLAPVNCQYLNVSDKVENIFSNPCTDKNHLVLAPGVLKSGGTNRACISRFHTDGPARLLLTLLTEDRLTTTASRELPPGDGGCLDLTVPQLPNTKADLIVKIQYPEAQCTWERRLTLRISSGRVLIVQTERVRYRLGDTVRARVLALKPDLAPSHGSIEEVWLEGPRGAWEGTRVAQWLRLRTRLGLGHLQYQLDTLAPPGKWTLRAKLEDGSQAAAVFWVGNYELPPFQLSVRHAPRVLRTSERLVWTVCVRYPWSEAVEGILVIRLRGAGGGGAGVRTAVQLRAPKACHRHAIAAKRVGLHSQNPPEVLVADFSFQEEGTRIWQNTTVVSQVVEKPVTLEFLTKHRAVIARGLPYKLKVKATRWDDKPAVKEQVQVCRYPASAAITGAEGVDGQAVTSHELCAEGETDGSGVARLMFAAVQGDAPFYRFQAQLKNDSSCCASLSVRVRSGPVQAALGPLRADARHSRTLVPLYINAHVTAPLTVHFVVITRGGIIYRWGATTQCPTSNSADQIRTTPRNYKCNDNYYAYNRDVMAQRDNPHSSDDGTSKHRSIRSFNSILEAESDPNSIPIDPFHISEKPKNISEIIDKIRNNRINPDFHPNAILPSQNLSTKNIWNESTELPKEELRTSNTPSSNIDQQYHIMRVNPSPVLLPTNQSQKYHIILRNSLLFQKDDSTPIVSPKLQYPPTQSRTTNMPTDLPNPTDNHQHTSTNVPIYNHQHWLNNVPTDPHQHWSTNIPAANNQHWSTKKPINKHQHWLANIPDDSHQHWSNLGNRVPTDNHQQWPTPTHNDIRSEAATDNVTAVTSDALLERKLKVMLPIKVSHQMCPDSHLIAYFYYNGELVSAAKHFEISECFANKVEASWLTRQAQPGSTVSLQVSSPGPALCALTVLDTATKWVQPPPTTKELLMNNLKHLIDSHRNLTEYDAAGECFLNSDAPDIPTTSIELTSSWLASAGVRMLGGEAPRAALRRCQAPPPAALYADDPAPRSDFSEAWLWRVLPVGPNGTGVASARAPDSITRYEAGVTCVSKSGVAVSPPAVLQVFREFFVHADGPRRLRRGDSALVRYRIFNYLYEPLSVQIQVLTDPHMEASTDSLETACLAGRSSVARRVRVAARLAGPALLRLRARAVADGSCPNATTGTTVSDEVVIKMVIEPEGVPVLEQKSILLCGNDSAGPRGPPAAPGGASLVEWAWGRAQAVPGTETLTLWAVGDMSGPLLADADSLVTIPRGCGEQNMAQLATNLLALAQLEPTSIAALIAREHVARGFTRQLQYVHPSGGFSAFGPSDVTSSTWLTAFAVKHLRKAHQLLWPNLQAPPALIRAERWLLSQQMENGCFRNEGQVFHRELRGGLNEDGEIASVALTAYVITSLIDSTAPVSYRVLRNTLSCLRALPPLKSQSPTRVYAHALLAYAFMKVEKYEQDLRKTNNLNTLKLMELEEDGVRQLFELLKVARRSNGYVWWEASSLSTSIEATSYALLAICSAPAHARASGGTGDAIAALRWLAAHRSTSGGFVSTQDTLVALEALTLWSSLNTPFTHLNVTTRSDDRSQTVTLVPGVRIPDIMTLVPGERLSVTVQGRGCALVQATRSYHTLAPSPAGLHDKPLSVQVAVHTDGPFDCDTNRTSCFCAAVIEACVMWSGDFPEMALLEVSLPGGYGADAQLLYSQLNQPGSLLRRIELSPTGARATLYLGSRDGAAPARAGGHQCFAIHAVGPRAATRPAYARVQDYYAPERNDTQLFTIPEDCPPRITHDSPQYTSSDNLFDKARSLDGDEILITHEFNFEDIPEGIPLEDPLYDNLTKREKEVDSEEIERFVEAENKVLNTTDSTETSNPNVTDNQPPRNGNFDTFTLNNVEGIHISIPNIKTDSSHNIDTTKLQYTDIKPAIISNNNDRRIFVNIRIPFDKIESKTTIKPIVSEKLSLPIENKHIDNPNLADFHIIDTDRDLDVPSGVEGPIPAVVLPPKNFVPPQHDARVLKTAQTSRGAYMFYEPPQYVNRRYFVPRAGRDLDNYQHYKIRKNIR